MNVVVRASHRRNNGYLGMPGELSHTTRPLPPLFWTVISMSSEVTETDEKSTETPPLGCSTGDSLVGQWSSVTHLITVLWGSTNLYYNWTTCGLSGKRVFIINGDSLEKVAPLVSNLDA